MRQIASGAFLKSATEGPISEGKGMMGGMGGGRLPDLEEMTPQRIVMAGMQGDRAQVVFSDPEEISTLIKKDCGSQV